MLAAFVPIWVLTGLGWLLGRRRLLGPDAERVLGGFVFHLAMPAALFTTLSRTPLAVHPRALGAFALSTVGTMAAGFAVGAVWRRSTGESTIGAMAAGYVNSANLGIPVALQVLGDAAFLTEVLLFQVLVVTPVILTVLDRATGRPLRPGRLLTLPLRNPVIAGPALGALCSGAGWRPPEVVAGPLALLGAAAVPTALVALGLSLTGPRPAAGAPDPLDARPDPAGPVAARPDPAGVVAARPDPAGPVAARPDVDSRGAPPRGRVGSSLATPGRALVAAASGLKLLVQPLLAWSVGLLAGVRPPVLLALVVCAALPTAQNTYIFAREYGRGEAVARETVIATTALSMATLAAVGALLG